MKIQRPTFSACAREQKKSRNRETNGLPDETGKTETNRLPQQSYKPKNSAFSKGNALFLYKFEVSKKKM
jgi:hypothetical protein